MQFISSRQVNFGITVNGQRMVVMFGDISGANCCTFTTNNEDIANAIMRHSYFKKGIVSLCEQSEVKKGKSEKAKEQKTVNSEQLTVNNEAGAVNSEQLTVNNEAGAVSSEQLTVNNEAESGEMTFANFTEAKEWFCKKYNVAKSSVKNPSALTSKAKEMDITIKIG